MVLVALILWGITGVTQKLSTNHISAEYSFVWFAMAFVPIAILVLLAEGGAAAEGTVRFEGNLIRVENMPGPFARKNPLGNRRISGYAGLFIVSFA